jgi:hypothetical protein
MTIKTNRRKEPQRTNLLGTALGQSKLRTTPPRGLRTKGDLQTTMEMSSARTKLTALIQDLSTLILVKSNTTLSTNNSRLLIAEVSAKEAEVVTLTAVNLVIIL